MTVDVLTVGETMVALRADGLIRLGGSLVSSVAGAESNVAIGLSRLGHHAGWLGRVGADQTGDLVVRTLRAENVDASLVRVDETASTGLILFEKRLPDLTRVEYHRADSAGSRLSDTDVRAAFREPPQLLHLTGITPALSESAREAVELALALAREAGVPVSFDVNYRRRLWDRTRAAATLRPLAARADLVIASADELDLVADGPDELLARGPRELIVKRGAAGASAYTARGVEHAPAREVTARDSVGAGDAFCAGYLSAYLDGADVTERLRRATVVAAFAIASVGDWEGLPTRGELGLVDAQMGTALR